MWDRWLTLPCGKSKIKKKNHYFFLFSLQKYTTENNNICSLIKSNSNSMVFIFLVVLKPHLTCGKVQQIFIRWLYVWARCIILLMKCMFNVIKWLSCKFLSLLHSLYCNNTTIKYDSWVQKQVCMVKWCEWARMKGSFGVTSSQRERRPLLSCARVGSDARLDSARFRAPAATEAPPTSYAAVSVGNPSHQG